MPTKDFSVSLTIEAFLEGFDQISKGIENATKKIEKFGSSLEKAGKSLSIGLTIPLTGFAALAIKNFDQAEKAAANLRNSLANLGITSESTFNAINADAEKLANNSVFGKSEILNDVSAKLLQFRNITEDAFPTATQLAVDLAAKFNVDLAQAASTVGKALNQPLDGLNSLNRIGIQFTNVEKQQVEQLLAANKGFEAQQLIIDKLNRSVAGAAETLSKTALGPLQRLRKNFGDFTEQFGKAILTVFNPFIEKLNEILVRNQNLGSSFTELAVKIGSVGIALGPVLATFGAFLKNISVLINPFTILLGVLIGVTSALDFLADRFAFTSRILSFLNTISFSVVATLTFMVEVLVTAARGWAELGAIIEKVTRINLGIEGFKNGLITIENAVREFRQRTSDIANQEALNIFKGEKRDVLSFNDIFKDFDTFLQDMNKAGEKAGGQLKLGAIDGFNKPPRLEERLSQAGQIISDSFATTFSNIESGAESLGQAFSNLGKRIIDGLFGAAVQNAFNALFRSLGGIFTEAGIQDGSLNITGQPISTSGVETAAEGGLILGPGSGTSDSILARLSNGEFVMPAKRVAQFGVAFFENLRRGLTPSFYNGGYIKNFGNYLNSVPRFADGGIVNSSRVSTPVSVVVNNNSSTPLQQTRTVQTEDINGIIVTVFLDDLKKNGRISQGISKGFNIKR